VGAQTNLKLSDIKARILIIDDDADVRNAVRMTLESERGVSYAFTEADSVTTGLEALKSIVIKIFGKP
jgi:DNA-binding NtrC family response regulator